MIAHNKSSNFFAIGLIGGIGSGKTYIANLLEKKIGISTINADLISEEIIAQDFIQKKIYTLTPESFMTNDWSSLSKKKLAQKIFSDTLLRKEFEKIMHPPIKKEIKKRLMKTKGVVSLDAPLLLESGLDSLCSCILFIEAPQRIRESRTKKRKWDKRDLFARESTQLPLDEKREKAHYVLKNDGSCSEKDLTGKILMFLNECLPSDFSDLRTSI